MERTSITVTTPASTVTTLTSPHFPYSLCRPARIVDYFWTGVRNMKLTALPEPQQGALLRQAHGDSPQRPVRVLSIDGGGVRGLVPAIVLADIERRTGRRICELFDVVAGTSTGAII
ncbi:MAG TPA: patatin-like phospholipase family protein, partial [Acidimicrobiales bacterium]|nr:patatin-like phospholipase family protein [Acidimicrobiales bacterium]